MKENLPLKKWRNNQSHMSFSSSFSKEEYFQDDFDHNVNVNKAIVVLDIILNISNVFCQAMSKNSTMEILISLTKITYFIQLHSRWGS